MKVSISVGSDVLYHLTGIRAAANILRSNRFELKPSEGTDAEQRHGSGKFYLSTARSPTSAYIRRGLSKYSVLIKLDGRKLGQRFKIKAVDYWGTNDRQGYAKIEMRRNNNEMEDRVFSDSPFIPNAASYIQSIHAPVNEDNRKAMVALKKMGMLRKIPVFFYTSKSDLLSMDPKKAVQIKIERSDFKDTVTPEDRVYQAKRDVYNFRNAFLRRWLEVYKMPVSPDGVGDAVKKLNKGHGYKAYLALRYPDAVQRFKTDLHNAKSVPYGDSSREREYLDKLVMIMRKNKQTPEQFIKALQDKWYPRGD